MRYVWDASKRIAGWMRMKRQRVFLSLNILVWSMAAFFVSLTGFLIVSGTVKGHGMTVFLITAYAGLTVGLYGGIFFLYNQNRHEPGE